MANITTILNLAPVVKTQKFTSSGTFTVPDNVYTLIVTMCGGGGGSVTSISASDYFGAGGSSGYYLNIPIAVTPSSSLTITVGVAGTSSYFNGSTTGTVTAGGNSSIYNGATELLTAYGGQHGARATSAPAGDGGAPNGSGGAAGFSTVPPYAGTGYLTRSGGPGSRMSATVRGGGYERDPFFGTVVLGVGKYSNGCRNSPILANAASPIPLYGAGAPGAYTTPVSAEPGVVILTWIEQ